MVRGFPKFTNDARIERRAQRISDPLERLKYLRQATGAAIPPRAGHQWNWLALFVLAVVVLPLHTVSDANVRRTLDPKLPMPAARKPADILNVWLVDKTNDFETYSNGLRIENRLSVA